MGMKHRVDQRICVCSGSMNPQLAKRTGFTNAETLKAIPQRLFEDDASPAGAEGSMARKKAIWWHHDSKADKRSLAGPADVLLQV